MCIYAMKFKQIQQVQNAIISHIDHERATEHQEHEPRFEPAIKDVTENSDEQVQQRMLRPELEQHEIANQERRQEVEKENLGRENHGLDERREARDERRFHETRGKR